MMNRVVLLACFAMVVAESAKDEASSAIKRAMKGVSEELQSYLTEQSHNFFEILMTDKLHENYDFRVVLEAKALQCYYQEAEPETSFTVRFECVDSPSFVSSGKISATAVEISKKEDILSVLQNQRTGELEFKTTKAGTYGVCFDNGVSGVSAPATVQITFDIWRLGEIPKYHAAELAGNNTMYHAFDRLFQVTTDVSVMRSAMSHTRSTLYYDYFTRMSNLSRITNFSLLSIVLIISVCFIQLRIVKKMFSNQRNSV